MTSLSSFNIFLTLFINFKLTSGYTAPHRLESFVNAQNDIVHALEDSIKHSEEALKMMKRKLENFKDHNTKAREDLEGYIGNPLYMVTLIKRLSIDLDKIIHTQKSVAEKILARLQFPILHATVKNFEEAVLGLVKIMEFYDQSVEDLSNSRIGGKLFDIPLTDEDCYYIGKILNENENYEYSIEWMKKALSKRINDSDIKPEDIVRMIGEAYYSIGDYQSSFLWYDKLVKLSPNDVESVRNWNKIYKIVEANKINSTPQQIKSTKYFTNGRSLKEQLNFHSLCRGDLDLSPQVTKKLHCFYKHGKAPFLKITPIKVEEVYLEPNVYIYHDVISDDEIAQLRNVSKYLLKKMNSSTSQMKLKNAPKRVNEHAWLKREDNPGTLLDTLHMRIQDITDLSSALPEDLQIVAYGLGGANEPHFDYLDYTKVSEDSLPLLNRIGTFMFYLTEVEKGGKTAFTRLGTAVSPKKGNAVYWRNLHPSTQGDTDSEHASCPVLLGTKYIALAGQLQQGNELTSPCTLEFQPEGGRGNLIPPIVVNK